MRIFGTDGVRGRAGTDITASMALRIGIAAGVYFHEKSVTNKILVGKDTRRSGYMLENALVSGLTSVGYDVIQVGPMPTPAISFLTEDMRCDAGVMISASHNTYEDNGIKFFDKFGLKLSEEAEKEIEVIYKEGDNLGRFFKTNKDVGQSKRIDDVIGRYIVHIKHSFPKNLTLQRCRVVLDCANGAAYRVAPSVFMELGADVHVINDKPNGFNINERCGATNPRMLVEEVKRLNADVGFALDGDADRLLVVDNCGNVVNGDKLIGALALYQKDDGALDNNGVVITVMSNLALEEFLASHGIKTKRCSVGDKYVLQAMQGCGYMFGGEQSGHIIFPRFVKTGDGLVSALQVMALMIRSGKSSSKAFDLFSLYPQRLINHSVSRKVDLSSIDGFSSLVESLDRQNVRHVIRYSGTESKLRILIESRDESSLEKSEAEIAEFLRDSVGY